MGRLTLQQIGRVLRTYQAQASLDKHGRVNGFHSNHLEANIPIEDRKFIGKIANTSMVCAGVLDGHGGHRCAQAINERLLGYIAASVLHSCNKLPSPHERGHLRLVERFRFPDEYFTVKYEALYRRSLSNYMQDLSRSSPLQDTGAALCNAFVRLDEDLSREVGTSDKWDGRFVQRVVSGACASVALIEDDQLIAANLGDCRVIVGRKVDSKWQACQLGAIHDAGNLEEVLRILKEHPASERRNIIQNQRLFGALTPLRAFGDVMFKWDTEDLRALQSLGIHMSHVASNVYNTPPYLTAHPEITYHTLLPNDHFAILSTDGLFDFISPDLAVSLVGSSLDAFWETGDTFHKKGGIRKLNTIGSMVDKLDSLAQKKEYMVDSNSATKLIRYALGGSGKSPDTENLNAMLTLPNDMIRFNRDDISIIVIYFNEFSTKR